MLQPEGPHGNGLVFTASNRVGSAGQRPAGVPARPLPGLHRRPAPPLWPHPSPSVGLAAPPPSKELCGQQQSCPIVLEGVQERTAADGFWKKVEKIRGKRSEGRRNLPPQSRRCPTHPTLRLRARPRSWGPPAPLHVSRASLGLTLSMGHRGLPQSRSWAPLLSAADEDMDSQSGWVLAWDLTAQRGCRTPEIPACAHWAVRST